MANIPARPGPKPRRSLRRASQVISVSITFITDPITAMQLNEMADREGVSRSAVVNGILTAHLTAAPLRRKSRG